jgi:hypothetical protein
VLDDEGQGTRGETLVRCLCHVRALLSEGFWPDSRSTFPQKSNAALGPLPCPTRGRGQQSLG